MEETLDLMTKIASLLNIILVPLIAWGYRSDKKNTSDALKRHEERIEKNEDALNDLKNELPFIYVTQQHFVQTMNNLQEHMRGIDAKLDKIVENIFKTGGG